MNVKGIRVENARAFGGPWLGLELMDRLGLRGFLDEPLPWEREEVPPSLRAATLILARLCEPSSELHIAEHFYRHSALSDLLGVPEERVNEDRLYRTLDALWPQKEALEVFLKNRLGTLFKLEYDLLLYDVTSTYFEGQAKRNPLARHGYSRDHRPDCLQVCIALVVSKSGMPIGYEVFEGNRSDMKTLQPVVTVMEKRYGKAARIWVVDRGMASEENVTFLREGGRRCIVGTPKAMLKRFERDLMAKEWPIVREGLEVKLCPSPDGGETFILCRSRERREKEKAMHDRFEKRIEEGLAAVQAQCKAKRCEPAGLGDEPRRVLDELSKLQVVDIVLPTKKGTFIRKRCVSRPNEHQAILLQRLGLNLPAHLGTEECSDNS